MGVFNPLTSLSFIFFLFLLIRPLFADIDSRKTPPPPQNIGDIASSNSSSPPPLALPPQSPQSVGDIASSNSSSPPPPPPAPAPPTANIGDITTTSSNSSSARQEGRDFSPFRPSIAVIVGVLTTMFSVTFLILLYAKHCKRGLHFNNNSNDHMTYSAPPTTRKNSGIDRAVIESLPIFRFSSLRGQKDGLECAVCLNKFETTEVLKLLPKCKHAFHVECVDTWLDAHSTCPLCRFRIDPEDVLLIGDPKILHENQLIPPTPQPQPQARAAENVVGLDIENGISRTELVTRRILGRHSSAGEKASGGNPSNPTVFRKSLDSACKSVAVGCFDRPRKDGMLLTNNKNSCKEEEAEAHRTSLDRRFEHRILVSNSAGGGGGGLHQRWSDVHPSDLLYLRSEMIISNSHRLSSSGSGSGGNGGGGGRSVINTRSVSEITGLSRSSNNNNSNNTIGHYCYYHHNIINNRGRQEAGVVSRWLAWISSRSQQERTTSSSDTVV